MVRTSAYARPNRASALAGALAACCLTVALALATPARAQICDYRPSEILRGDLAEAVATGVRDVTGRLVTSAGGIFTLHSLVTGGSLVGPTLGGAGALGQIGQAAGSAAIGVATTPGVAVAGATAVLGAGAYEGLCFFRDDRITDYDAVLDILRAVADFADPAYFYIAQPGTGPRDAVIVLGDGAGETAQFAVDRLRIVNGVLLHRDRGRDTELGNLGFLTATLPDD